MVETPRNVAEPPTLVANRTKWTLRYTKIAAGSARGDWATRDAKRALSAALRKLAYGKCVFCETALEVSGFLEIEHYTAKTLAPDLAFEWTNLLPSCQLCNNSKRDADHGNLLLKPDAEDPEPHFWVHPDTGRLAPHPRLDAVQVARANRTIELCNLQRPALCTQRADMVSRVGRWLQHLSEDEWEYLSRPTTEYKLVIRHVLKLHRHDALHAQDKSLFESPI
jgi:uncharacterized protein (TIGR02646 family)